MSLPSVELLKDQASRLVTYLGDKHRFRLKPASALEAVAALYGKHDWNTLHGLAQRAAGEHGRADGHTPSREQLDSFPLTWSEHGRPQLTVAHDDWYRHTIASGGTLADRQAWLQQHFGEHVSRGGAGVFLNAFGKLRIAVREALHSEQLLVDLVNEDSTFHVNLMADMDADEVAAMTTELIFARDHRLTDDYWKQSATMVLSIASRALREAGQELTLRGLAELFPSMAKPAKLLKLMLSLPAGSDTRKHLHAILEPHGAVGGTFSEKTWAAHYSALSRALEQLSSSSWTFGLFATAQGAPGLFSLLSHGKCLVIECAERSAGLPECAVLYATRSAMARRHLVSRESRESVPWVLALGEVDRYAITAVARMAEQGRSTRMAMLMTTGDAEALNAHPAGRELLANVWNTLHLRGCSAAQLAELLAKMADKPLLVQPSRVTAAI